jgi:hypothetical protein
MQQAKCGRIADFYRRREQGLAAARLGAKMALSFLVGLFHSQQRAGLSRRTPRDKTLLPDSPAQSRDSFVWAFWPAAQ